MAARISRHALLESGHEISLAIFYDCYESITTEYQHLTKQDYTALLGLSYHIDDTARFIFHFRATAGAVLLTRLLPSTPPSTWPGITFCYCDSVGTVPTVHTSFTLPWLWPRRDVFTGPFLTSARMRRRSRNEHMIEAFLGMFGAVYGVSSGVWVCTGLFVVVRYGLRNTSPVHGVKSDHCQTTAMFPCFTSVLVPPNFARSHYHEHSFCVHCVCLRLFVRLERK